ncbi:polycomb protein SCMH1 [Exaiptasia diaphana]|uniref:SAM domain-containing protein n=1 Tax=Exaiptasia diaphana TaxID=2652724 RepID=A0A913Y0U2_EXADI|nr:polycomb protein SCMH1 [Exaiptasia diaphana]XP_020912289.1 polycomb protein SCMH1 [Exaiptasia diaphana]KXJ23692.1 Sex comb on midleg-like protein 2 [Exaiptasia diaphana]
MSEQPQSTDNTTEQPNTKNGEESFNEEIKNYAKTAMNELLGMFGYDDEITSESVNNLEIKVPSTEPAATNPVINTVPSVTAVTTSNTVTPSLPLNIPEDTSDDTPVIVKVEGNTTVNDIIRQQQNADSKISNETTPVQVTSTSTTAAVTIPNTTQSTPVNITMTTQSQTGQPTLGSKTITGYTKPTAALSSPVNTPAVASSNTASTSLSMFLKSTVQSQAVRSCTWCKKNTVLKNFTFRDGTRILECRNICSQDCFEMAALSIDLNNDNIKSIQWRIRQLRGRKPSPAKQNDKPSQVKKSESTVPVVSSRPARKAKPVGSQVARPLFNWEGYLKECRAKGAASSYFKQSSTPPYNGFRPGMKLEVADPRVIESTCLATVVGSIGPRIRFSFDGTDKTNDIWHMVDSADIHPVGWSEANNCQLQAPLGFTRDPGTYQKFVATTLTTVSPEMIAPPRLFKKDPAAPSKNLFKTGMKLEAVDPKNQALVCVATVGDVDGDKIRIDFDGYLGSDYWCGYDSRNIFPVGWCILNGHPLQPPGKKKRPIAPPSNRTKKDEEPPTKKHRTQTNVTSPTRKTSSSSSSTQAFIPASELYKSQPTVSLYVNHGCLTGRYLNKSKVAKLKQKWFGKCSEIIQPLIQGLVNCAHDQKTVFGFLKPGTGKTKITARGEGFETLSCSLQNIDRVKIFWRVLEKFLENLQCCENLISSNKVQSSCKKCRGKSGFSSSSKQAVETNKHRNSDNDVSSNQVCSTSPVKTWSVDEVIKYIESTELADHVTLFRVHEIDGRALLLLNRDMIMSYMGLKLGPAIKLLSIVDDLKPEEIVVD